MSRFPRIPDIGRLAGVIGFDPAPSSPILDTSLSISVGSAGWVEVGTYTVTAGKTFYLTDFYTNCGEGGTGTAFIWGLKVAGTLRVNGRSGAERSCNEHLSTPIKVTAGVAISLEVYHWGVGNKLFHSALIGFEV